jgi:hypothetical protein
MCFLSVTSVLFSVLFQNIQIYSELYKSRTNYGALFSLGENNLVQGCRHWVVTWLKDNVWTKLPPTAVRMNHERLPRHGL